MSAAAPMRGRGTQGRRRHALCSLPALLALLAPLAAGATLPPAATPLRADLRVEFSPGEGNRTRVQGTVAVPVDEAVLNSYGFYNLQLEGTVSVEGRTYDRFAYRFDVPGKEQAAAPLALSFERSLRPGAFQLEIRVRDVQSGRVALLERPLQVPRVAQQPAAESPTADTSVALAMDATVPSTSSSAQPAPPVPAPAVRIARPPRVCVGKQRFDAIARGDDVAKVTFALDGRVLMARTRPPFSVELDLGERAVRRRLRAEAFAADGTRLGADEVELNTDGDGFAVRLRRPSAAAQQSGSVTARAEVMAPRGRRIDRVELYLDERSVATVARAPFERQLALPGPDPTLLRAVAYLDDGTSAEDSVLLNAPNADEMDVDLVELYTAVVDGQGRPVRGLAQREFRIFEEGEEQRLDRFAEVSNLPVHVALTLDTSTSMTLRLPDVKLAAQAFLKDLVRPQDEVMIVAFDDVPRVRAGFTHDLAFLGNALEGLEARGGTALYDSLVFTLDQLQEVRGQRVLVLLSDGLDERSRHTADEVMELARRSAVTIYAIGIADSHEQAPIIDRQLLDKLASETGGRSFYVDHTRDLGPVYAEIERDVRSRYLLAYYSSNAGERSFREVDVKLAERRLSARTIRGYYP